jgi:cyclic pyranopterin phosphate synthase
MPLPPQDSYKRRIDYLRLSVTDRCNLRCTYCMPAEGVPRLTHEDILNYEEILRLARIAALMGIAKIRITGGEPLVRKDILFLCANMAATPGLKSLSLTTNGLLLSQYARGLFVAGIKRINISLDTLKPEKYAVITRKDCFEQVWAGIRAVQETGFAPIKLNAVIMQGINDDEIEDLACLTYHYPFEVRFIEFMPFQADDGHNRFVSADEILERLAKVAPLLPAVSESSNGPARHFRFPGALGKIGIISPISEHFCHLCNRLRVTADGKLRTCLFSMEEIDLKTPLRQGASDEEIKDLIYSAIRRKPERHELDNRVLRKCISRPMVKIGG